MDWIEVAQETQLTRPAVAELARRDELDAALAALPRALETDVHAATVLAFALLLGGRKLPSALVEQLVVQLDDVRMVVPLVLSVEGSPVDTILAVLESEQASWERETLVLYLATELLEGEPAPARLIAFARKLTRKPLDFAAGQTLAAAALRLDDARLLEAAVRFVPPSRGDKLVLAVARSIVRDAAQALPEVEPPRLFGGGTVRREAPGAGRNDPCPCGSGKKYKKCCASKPSKRVAEAPTIEAATLTLAQVEALRPFELIKLDLRRLAWAPLVGAYRRLLVFRRWKDAERCLEEMARRPDGKLYAGAIDDWRDELVQAALDAKEVDVARAHVARMASQNPEDARTALRIACLERPADLLERIEAAAHSALEDEAELDAIELAHSLLQTLPALGIFVARGALHEARILDSEMLLERMEDARDELLLPPVEPWWELYDALVAGLDEDEHERAEHEQHAALRQELRKAHSESRRATKELAKLQQKLADLDRAPEPERVSSPAPEQQQKKKRAVVERDEAAERAHEAERRRLQTKVQELQRIVGEGQEERRDLRRRITEAESKGVREPEPEREPAPDSGEAFEPEEDAGERAPRALLIPELSAQATKDLRGLDRSDAALALRVIAELAGGSDNAWAGVKRLQRARHVSSARAGIHHRVLFSVEGDRLCIAHVVPRRELEQVVARLG